MYERERENIIQDDVILYYVQLNDFVDVSAFDTHLIELFQVL